MNFSFEDLKAYYTRVKSMRARRGQTMTALDIPANAVLDDEQKAWLKKQGATVRQNGKDVDL